MKAWRAETNAPVPSEKNPEFDAEVEKAAIEAALNKKSGGKNKGKKAKKEAA